VIVVGSSAELGAATGDGRPLDETAPCRPLDDYGVSKLAQSAIAAAAFLRHGQHVVRVRLFNLVGPDLPESLLPGRCARALARVVAGGGGGHLSFGDLETRRDYVDIRDACRAIALALERGAAGELFHVGSGVAVSGREIVSRLVAEAREETGPVTFDEKVAGLPTVPTQQADPGHAKHALGWRPEIPLDRSLRDLWHSVRGLPEVSPRRGGGS
jgi:GDP-4-dehydro-6-deoxy-D-mannose reductase